MCVRGCCRGCIDAVILFYISGHGFGHASREVEIINQLGRRGGGPILIRSAVSPGLLRRTVTADYELLPGLCDTGIVQTTSISHDDAETVREALEFYRTFDDRVNEDLDRLAGRGVTLVVADIPPLAFEVALRLRVPSVAISNFTWDWIYETHPGFLPAGADVLKLLRAAYQKATLALELPFSGGFEIFPNAERVPLVARRPTRSRNETREFFHLRTEDKVALLSFGGYGLASLDLTRIDCAADWTVMTTDSVSPTGGLPSHVRGVPESAFLTSEFRYEDLIAAVDVVITKPGYGIIAECISTGTPMLYTSRGHFRESDVLIAALPRFVRSRFITQTDLLAGRWHSSLEALLAQPAPPEQMPINGAEVAADRIEALLGL